MSAEPQSQYDVFQAISDPTRREVLYLLSNGEMPVKAISECFPISRTAVSKHLHILSDAGLVKDRKVGRETRYRLHAEPLTELKDWLSYFEQFWDNKLGMLKYIVEESEK